jgi:hypothetical protein
VRFSIFPITIESFVAERMECGGQAPLWNYQRKHSDNQNYQSGAWPPHSIRSAILCDQFSEHECWY